MTFRVAVVDTNVVVAGLITRDPDVPTARIVDGMLVGGFPFVLSVDLLAEYRAVLLRPGVRRHHGLGEEEIDAILATLVANAIVREPGPAASAAPDAGDEHLWALLSTVTGSVLVTGDRALLESPPVEVSVLSPRAFSDSIGRAPG
jgi:predicted nucleic acid-binding protein